MIQISLLEFLRSGRFGPVEPGQTRIEIFRHLGKPDAVGGTSRKHAVPAIIKYGDIEFHLQRDDDRLWLIHADTFVDAPNGGSSVDLDPWIIRRDLPIEALQRALADEGIGFERRPDDLRDCMCVKVTAGVELSYVREDDTSSASGAPKPGEQLSLSVISLGGTFPEN